MSFHLYVLVVKLAVYLGETWSLWMVAVSFLLSPFWFNPLSFEPSMLWADFAQWREWMRGSGGTGEQSWLLWWREENALWRSLSPGWKLIMWCQRSLVWGMIGMGLVWRDFRGQSWADVLTSPAIICLVQVLGLLLALAHGNSLLSRVEHHLTYASRRVLSMLIASLAVLLLAERVMRHPLVLKYLLASYFLGSAIAFTLLLVFDGSGSRSRSAFTVTNRVLIPLYYMHDCILGLALFVMLFIMAYLLKVGIMINGVVCLLLYIYIFAYHPRPVFRLVRYILGCYITMLFLRVWSWKIFSTWHGVLRLRQQPTVSQALRR